MEPENRRSSGGIASEPERGEEMYFRSWEGGFPSDCLLPRGQMLVLPGGTVAFYRKLYSCLLPDNFSAATCLTNSGFK